MNPVGVLLIAVGIFLEALRTNPTWLNADWLGAALIIFGAVIVVFEWMRGHLG